MDAALAYLHSAFVMDDQFSLVLAGFYHYNRMVHRVLDEPQAVLSLHMTAIVQAMLPVVLIDQNHFHLHIAFVIPVVQFDVAVDKTVLNENTPCISP